METRNRNMGMNFFGRGRTGFGFGSREKMMKIWEKLPTEIKVELVDSKIETMKEMESHMKDIFSHRMQGFAQMSKRWEEMDYEEKVAFINEKEEAMKSGKFHHGHFFRNRDFSLESMDQFCKEWLAKTPEEKAESIKERESMFYHHTSCMNSFFEHHDMGFGEFCARKTSK